MVRLETIHRVMERQTTTNILFLDACRDNPLARNLAETRLARMKKLIALTHKQEGTDYVRDHKLIGLWEGDIGGAQFPDGSKRTLIIATVKSDGTVFGGWSATMHASFGLGADIRVDGDRVFVTTQHLSKVVLRRTGDDQLQGEFTLKNGKTYPVALSRRLAFEAR